MKAIEREIAAGKNNFIFVGEAGSGKSEIALNFALYLAKMTDKTVHFFDMDMTKPLFRSRDLQAELESPDIVFHYEEQFLDAPTIVGGVNLLLKDENVFVVMDVGGDHIGARAIGGYAPRINQENTIVYYVLNAYRPWSYDMDHIDKTLGEILGMSHIEIGQLHLINNPNFGYRTIPEEVIEGTKQMADLVSPYMALDFVCAEEDLYHEVKDQVKDEILPLHLFLTYPWCEQKA